jgi:hypothetical protein
MAMDVATGAGLGLGGVEPPQAAASRARIVMTSVTAVERAMCGYLILLSGVGVLVRGWRNARLSEKMPRP